MVWLSVCIIRLFQTRHGPIALRMPLNRNHTANRRISSCVCIRCRFSPRIEGMRTFCNYTMHFWIRVQGLPYDLLRFGVPTMLVRIRCTHVCRHRPLFFFAAIKRKWWPAKINKRTKKCARINKYIDAFRSKYSVKYCVLFNIRSSEYNTIVFNYRQPSLVSG